MAAVSSPNKGNMDVPKVRRGAIRLQLRSSESQSPKIQASHSSLNNALTHQRCVGFRIWTIRNGFNEDAASLPQNRIAMNIKVIGQRRILP